MKLTQTALPFDVFQAETNQTLNVLIVYDDFSSGQRAKRMTDRVLEQLGSEWHFRMSVWKLEILCTPLLIEEAAEDAAEADMIILAAHRSQTLPNRLKRWIDLWRGRKEKRSCALVLLLDEDEEAGREGGGVVSFLKRSMAGTRAAVFSQCETPSVAGL